VRVGQNPAKLLKKVTKPAEITAAVTCYIPFLTGYYAQSLELLKLSLESMRAHADLPFDLMVFDNGSCQEVRDYLLAAQDAGMIQYLILSEQNLGVVGAWNVLFGAAPGKYIAYSDYDIYFYPNWLSALVEVLETFPLAGMVTGLPLLTPKEFSSSTLAWAEQTPDVSIEVGQLISWEDYWRHSKSISPSKEAGEKFFAENQAYRIGFQGLRCYAGAGHFQFVGRKEFFAQILPLHAERPMGGEVRNLDIAINHAGYLRLGTLEWNVEHMGNTIQERFVITVDSDRPQASITTKKQGIARVQFIRRILEALYNWIFKLLYSG
jgi:glycosyltransferase involved in cell wall biosynthesis